MKNLFDAKNYQVVLLKEPITIEKDGLTVEINYGIFNRNTCVIESYSQFQPTAMAQATKLSELVDSFLEEKAIEPDGNVVKFDS